MTEAKRDFKIIEISPDVHIAVPGGLSALHEDEYIKKARADRPLMDAEDVELIEALAWAKECNCLESILKETDLNPLL
jgi:hypothetical protein